MEQILVYGDSLSWGIVPDTRERFDFHRRWPGVMERRLHDAGRTVRVIEDCLNGRRTVWEDPFKAGRDGRAGLAQRIEINSPLALLVICLGTNDFQSVHQYQAWHSAQGVAALVDIARRAPLEPGMALPEILLVAPPPILHPKGVMARKFAGADARCRGLADEIRAVAEAADCHFFDAGSVTAASRVDGVHLDEDQHLTLGTSMAEMVKRIMAPGQARARH